MRFQHLDLNLLVALNALLTERSVSLAAGRLHITQPAMSHALNRLRQHFADELLVPSGRRLLLTPRAEALIQPLRAALLQIETIMGESPQFDPAISVRRFTILASDYSLSVSLARAISRMKAVAPGIGFEVAYPEEPLLKLERGEADLIILPQQYLLPDHPFAPLYEDEYVVVVWSGSQLVNEAISVERYFELGHVAVRFGLGRQPAFAEGVTLAAPQARRIEIVAPSFTLVPLLVMGTQLLGSMPRRLAELAASTLPLTLKPLPFAAPKIYECVQWSKLRSDDLAIAWVIENLRICSS